MGEKNDTGRKTQGRRKLNGRLGEREKGGKTQDARRMEEFDKVEEIEEVEDPPLRNSADFHLRLSARKRKAPSTPPPLTPPLRSGVRRKLWRAKPAPRLSVHELAYLGK